MKKFYNLGARYIAMNLHENSCAYDEVYLHILLGFSTDTRQAIATRLI